MHPTQQQLLDALQQVMTQVELVLGRRVGMLTTSEFAQVTGRHRKTIEIACARGEIRATQNVKRGRYLIPVAELTPFLEGDAA